jgi:hypothetical protein
MTPLCSTPPFYDILTELCCNFNNNNNKDLIWILESQKLINGHFFLWVREISTLPKYKSDGQKFNRPMFKYTPLNRFILKSQ